MVRSVQDEMRTTQRQERQQQWVQAQTQAQAERSERLRKFVSEAGLSYSQEQEFTRRMQEEEVRRQALLDAVSAGTKSRKYEELRREDGGQRRPGRGRPDAP